MWSVVVLWKVLGGLRVFWGEVCGGLGWFAVVWACLGNSMVPSWADCFHTLAMSIDDTGHDVRYDYLINKTRHF